MKKTLLTAAILMAMAFCANAQSDNLYKKFGNDDYSNRTDDNNFVLPNNHGAENDFDSTPLGSGLLVLTALGAGYAAMRKRKQ